LILGIGVSGTSGKLLPTTNDLAFQDRDIATIQGLLGYLNCKRDSYIVYLILGVEEDNPDRLYKSPILVPKWRGKKDTSTKSVWTLLIKKEKGQKGPALKKIKREASIEVSSYNLFLTQC
jgi:hypothetical protein